jgi:hypothetical protein
MADVGQMKNFLHSFFRPALLDSFSEIEDFQIKVIIHHESDMEEIILDNIYPFLTLYDLKLLIYMKKDYQPSYEPSHVFFARQIVKRYVPIDYLWYIGASSIFSIKDPFELVRGDLPIDVRFVDSQGNKRILKGVDRRGVLLEDFLPKQLTEMPIFHVFLYDDMKNLIPGERPISQKEWNGRLLPFFPTLSATDNKYKGIFQKYAAALTKKIANISKLETFLDHPLQRLSFSGIQLLRLVWPTITKIPGGIESVFYEVAVNERVPYMRFISMTGSSVSKFHLLKNGQPDIEDARTLKRWATETNPTPNHDFLMAKIRLKPSSFNEIPIHTTLRLMDDGSADLIALPVSANRKLDPDSELKTFPESLMEGLENFSYIKTAPEIGNATLTFNISVKNRNLILTKNILRARLELFSPFFQEIPAISNENSLIMLRYKLVSNFAQENRIFNYITQIINRKLVQGDKISRELIGIVADEFQLEEAVAQKYISDWYARSTEIVAPAVEGDKYILNNNPGIDIAVFAQHPFYSFHIYRLESYINLRRILTLLSMLFTIDSDKFTMQGGQSDNENIYLGNMNFNEEESADSDAPATAAAPPTAAATTTTTTTSSAASTQDLIFLPAVA